MTLKEIDRQLARLWSEFDRSREAKEVIKPRIMREIDSLLDKRIELQKMRTEGVLVC